MGIGYLVLKGEWKDLERLRLRVRAEERFTDLYGHGLLQAEPKDYDINAAPLGTKNLCASTYKRFGVEDKVWKSEMHEEMAKIDLKPTLEGIEVKHLVNEDTLDLGIVERETGMPRTGFGAILSRHPPNHRKMSSDTTYRVDYVPLFDYEPASPPFQGNYSIVHRKCRSQFTDIEDERRRGYNKWHDESGIYGNSVIKQKLFPVTDPLTHHLK
uniref:Uncharacterized protein n=1 Tax=Ornithorhynchus anatinus TaxID=9258 RepID=A0A6I8NQY4_ORNAN